MPDEYYERLKAYNHRTEQITSICSEFNVSASTVFRHLKEYGITDDFVRHPPSYWIEKNRIVDTL